ncbi:MAG: polyphosphate polymerase domain-containing protein [Bacteroidales bacterium]|nr:polyphosphate polymerase domain-containing protein [Bacteroidales bacterium]
MNAEILDIINQMAPITLEEMKSVRLMNRIDTKYLVTSGQLLAILNGVKERYYAQEVENHRLSPYRTVYYDTPALTMYTIHHDKRLVRDKVRVRTYVDSELTFCEIKHKTNKGRTKKKRIEVTPRYNVTEIPEVAAFLAENQPYPVETLQPTLVTAFDRITLVNFEKTERLTIDCNLCFDNLVAGRKASMDDLVVMELKQDGRAHSLLKDVLLELRIKPFKMSKYCIGICMTRPEVKQNRFKKKLHHIDKLKHLS